MRVTRIAATAAVVSAVLAAVGCGGGGAENDYAEAYSAVTAKVEQQLGTLQATPNGDPAKLGAQLRTVAGALREAGNDFAAIEAPDNAKAAHAKVQAGVNTLAADVRKSANVLADTTSPAEALDALTAITSSKGAAQIAAGEQQLRQAGYQVQ